MIKLNGKEYVCPIDVTLALIGGKWKILILAHLHRFNKRGFSDVRDNLPKVSEKMLSQQLKELEHDGLIKKKVLTLKPYRVEYSLDKNGASLSPLYEFVSKWGVSYLKEHGINYMKDQNLYK